MFAARHPSACVAFEERRVSPAVLEKYGLLAVVEGSLYFGNQLRGERCGHHFFSAQFLYVFNVYLGQAYLSEAFVYFDQSVFSRTCVGVAFERGGGCAQKCFCAAHAGEHYCGVARVVSRGGFLLFVRRLVFFVYDDEAEVLHGQEERAAHSHYQFVGIG